MKSHCKNTYIDSLFFLNLCTVKNPACITIITQEEGTDRKEEKDKLEKVKVENEGLEELERDKVGIEDVDVEQFLEENAMRKQHLQEQCAKEQLQSIIYV